MVFLPLSTAAMRRYSDASLNKVQTVLHVDGVPRDSWHGVRDTARWAKNKLG